MSPGCVPRPSLSDGAVSANGRERPVSPGCVPRPSLSVGRHQRDPRLSVVSPGCVPRPSLSGLRDQRRDRRGRVSPGCLPRPSLSVRRHRPAQCPARGVAGVRAPAFVERVQRATRPAVTTYGVAGVRAPAFVERTRPSTCVAHLSPVSPGCVPRPSLSVRRRRGGPRRTGVSPGCVPRPSLSGPPRVGLRGTWFRVAGVRAPAFVERGMSPTAPVGYSGVAGVRAPAFVERSGSIRLSADAGACRRGACPGLR